MSRHLTPDAIDAIVVLIEKWEGKLSWPLLVNAVFLVIGSKYSRQTLSSKAKIQAAFDERKQQLKTGSKAPKYYTTREVDLALQQLERLKLENKALKKERDTLLGQISIWSYNAAIKGLSERELNAPIPSANRK
ncbi:hypothetical protein [uncultured Pseudodesulfovibrio sp.]|uniref:hypothetical protein n=1 Tax=uncultured Pseudodesulfovibrio sp. TaxID=2035858 RepID=UPI0029C7EA3A|nr:hypothetical protein [uncultured Pseudodesulfovibrio sp.]